MALRKDLVLRRPQGGRLEGRTRLIQPETKTLPCRAFSNPTGAAAVGIENHLDPRRTGLFRGLLRQRLPRQSRPDPRPVIGVDLVEQ